MSHVAFKDMGSSKEKALLKEQENIEKELAQLRSKVPDNYSVCVPAYLCVHVSMPVCVCVHVSMPVCVSMRVCVCMHVCVSMPV
jgi:hypothetical protein